MSSKKLLFVTTHNLATNPRLFKEIQLAIEQAFEVEVVCFEFNNWSYNYNKELLKQLNGIKVHIIQAGRKPFWPWFISSSKEWLYRKLSTFIILPTHLLSQAVSKRSDLLIKELQQISDVNLIIAHNPGALWPAVQYAKKNNCRAAFDVEDYHPGEGNDPAFQKNVSALLKRLLPQISYVSFASPLIQKETEKLTNAATDNWFTVMNYFPAKQFNYPVKLSGEKIKLVWFSQNINFNRGLETVLTAFAKKDYLAELHLYGNMHKDFYEQFVKKVVGVIVHGPLPQDQLHGVLNQYDVGLALEPGKDNNNLLAVSNKMIAYLQSGLFIIASNTPAQSDLLNKYPGSGIVVDLVENEFDKVLEAVIGKLNDIRKGREQRFVMNQHGCWEHESVSLLKYWDQIIDG